MKLAIQYTDFCRVIKGTSLAASRKALIQHVALDSRKIVSGPNTAFFALMGEFRNGHSFIENAYSKGVRVFVVSQEVTVSRFHDAQFIHVQNTLFALQELAIFHRSLFHYPIIAITGSTGKTTVKEWLYQLIRPTLRIIRSPKSYNSQLGVALSLLELHADADLAIIEVGISHPEEMARLEEMVRPTLGIFTAFGRAHAENFASVDEHLKEKLLLFRAVKKMFYTRVIPLSAEKMLPLNGELVLPEDYNDELAVFPFRDNASLNNGLLAIAVAQLFVKDEQVLRERIQALPQLALRMETFDGINGSMIINDTYNLDLDALNQSLEYQLRVAGDRKRVVIIGLDEDALVKKEEVAQLVKDFQPDEFILLKKDEKVTTDFGDAVILIKGTRKADMQHVARQFRLKHHKTHIEIDLSAVRHNLTVFKGVLSPDTQLLAMVKSQAYGSGVEKVAAFLEQQGIHYLGVAYSDEGVELRKQGIKLPILVMNAEEEGFEDCIAYQLEPAMYSFHQMDVFIKELIAQGKTSYPVHLKIDTGMKRLGVELSELPQVVELITAQPEIRIKSVYSHLADADNRRDKRFTELQLQRFEQATRYLAKAINYSFDRHILNSEGIANFPTAHYEMVRLGIGMYGISSNPLIQKKLRPVLKWRSAISQLKHLSAGESVSYSRTFIADKSLTIAVIPVGYADGLRRSLSNGKGGVFIHNTFCPILGRVCMDMIMVDVTQLPVKEGDPVEIIGEQQSLEQFAQKVGTIPYEIMTSISKRVHRIYLE